MIKPAIQYSSRLLHEFQTIWFEEKYKFFNNAVYYKDFMPDDNSWDRHQFVSVDQYGNLLGYIGYDVCRTANYAHTLAIINFTDNKLEFAVDLKRVLEDIFEKFNFNKLSFMVVIGNPVEKAYDRLIAKYGGRIVGIHKQDVLLHDNKLYDIKQYEILKEDYMKSRYMKGE